MVKIFTFAQRKSQSGDFSKKIFCLLEIFPIPLHSLEKGVKTD
jgi:hypothetical protein